MLKISIISLGNKMPEWVTAGTNEYAKRFADGVQFKLIEIPLMNRTKASDMQRILEKESALLKQAIPKSSYLIALESTGKSFSSEELAEKISLVQHKNSHLCFLIGGPEGLASDVVQMADERWSLSRLTLPHPLVRIFLVETLYRAWTIMNKHPYHK